MEMSLVLVIVGLLVGGIVVGRLMIETAQARGVLTELEKYEAAANTFKLKYNYLPGDIPNASRYGLSVISSGFGPNGNGNSLIDSYANHGYQAGEVILFWRHLQQAGLIKTSIEDTLTDSCAPNISPNPDINHFKKYYPLSTSLNNGAQWIAFPGYSRDAATWGVAPTHGGGYDGSNYLMLAFINYHSTCEMKINSAETSSYSPTIPYYMDSKRDDGLPNSGKIMIVDNTGGFGSMYGGPNFFGSTACLTSATAYNLTGNYSPVSPGGGGPNWDRAGCTTLIKANY